MAEAVEVAEVAEEEEVEVEGERKDNTFFLILNGFYFSLFSDSEESARSFLTLGGFSNWFEMAATPKNPAAI